MRYEDYLYKLIKSDERFFILTAENRAAIRNLPQRIPNNFLDTGIMEQTMVGVAAGLALRGRIPIIHALAAFLTMRAFEFIRTDIGIAKLPVKIVGSVAGFLSEANGPTHQAIEDISLMRGIPNVNIFCPADEEDMLICLNQILYSPSPFYIRFNSASAQYKHSKNFDIGKAEIISEGKDITFLTYGFMFSEVLKIKEILEKQGYSVGVINLRTLKPIDISVIVKVLTNSNYIFTVEDHFLTGGLFSIVAEIALNYKLKANVFPFAFSDKWFKPSLLRHSMEYEKMSADEITKTILNKINY